MMRDIGCRHLGGVPTAPRLRCVMGGNSWLEGGLATSPAANAAGHLAISIWAR